MINDLKTRLEQLVAEQKALNEEVAKTKLEAVKHVQEIISCLGISAHELTFPPSGSEQPQPQSRPARPTRAPAVIKYRLPNGAEWTGKGLMKSEFRDYLKQEGLTKDDLELFLTEEYVAKRS